MREGKFIECENILVEGDGARRIDVMEWELYCYDGSGVMPGRSYDKTGITGLQFRLYRDVV